MFDIGFFELVVIAVIALLVLGPERMPHAIRMTGAWMGKFRRAAMSVREEIEREVNAYEVQQRIKEQLEQSGVNDTKDILRKAQQTLRDGILDDATLKQIEQQEPVDYATMVADTDPNYQAHSDDDDQPHPANNKPATAGSNDTSDGKQPPPPASKSSSAAVKPQHHSNEQTAPGDSR